VNWNSGTETLTLSGYDTLAHYQTALSQLQYNATGNNPTNYGNNTTRTVTWQVNDGAIGNPVGPNQTTTTLNIDAVDDAPVNNLPASPSINEDTLATISGLTITDVDADPANHNIQVAFTVSHGTLTLNTSVAGGIVSGDITGGASGTASITVLATQNKDARQRYGTAISGHRQLQHRLRDRSAEHCHQRPGPYRQRRAAHRHRQPQHYRYRGERSAEFAATHDECRFVYRECCADSAVCRRDD
jgi:hypothetical protein